MVGEEVKRDVLAHFPYYLMIHDDFNLLRNRNADQTRWI